MKRNHRLLEVRSNDSKDGGDNLIMNMTHHDMKNNFDILRMSATPSSMYDPQNDSKDNLNESMLSIPIKAFYAHRMSTANEPAKPNFVRPKRYKFDKAQKSYQQRREHIKNRLKLWSNEVTKLDHFRTNDDLMTAASNHYKLNFGLNG